MIPTCAGTQRRRCSPCPRNPMIPETPGKRVCDFCHSAMLAKNDSQSCRRSLSNFDACDFAFQGYMSQQRADPGLQRCPMAPKIPTNVRGALAQAKRVLTCCMRLKTSKILFNEPVDPVALGLDDYRDKVKCPMDFGTIMGRLQDGENVEWKKCYYTSPGKVLRDVQLVFDNCFAYNDGPGDELTRELCSEVKANFEKRWREASLLLEPAEQKNPLPSDPAGTQPVEWMAENGVPAELSYVQGAACISLPGPSLKFQELSLWAASKLLKLFSCRVPF